MLQGDIKMPISYKNHMTYCDWFKISIIKIMFGTISFILFVFQVILFMDEWVCSYILKRIRSLEYKYQTCGIQR